jgi:hypothetical protein
MRCCVRRGMSAEDANAIEMEGAYKEYMKEQTHSTGEEVSRGGGWKFPVRTHTVHA